MTQKTIVPAPAKTNPFAGTLIVVGALALVAGALLTTVAPGALALIGLGLFLIGGFAIVGWLAVSAVRWRE